MNTAVITSAYSAITEGLSYETEANILKIIYSESFSDKSVKIKIFILQINNKIADTAEASEERKIHYKMSLLQELTAE